MDAVCHFNRSRVMYEKPTLQRYGTFREVTKWYYSAGTNDVPGGSFEPAGESLSEYEDDRSS